MRSRARGCTRWKVTALMGETKVDPESGEWVPAEPLPYFPGLDFEVHGSGPWIWQAYEGATEVASGVARTRFGLRLAIWRARRLWRRQ
jgi:hypothetical protein